MTATVNMRDHQWNIKKKYTFSGVILGEGSFGRAYLAQEKRTKEERVLKEIPLSEDPDDQMMLYNEVSVHTKLKHPYIVDVHDWTIDRSTRTMWMVLHYAPGGSLRDIVETLHGLGFHMEEKICRAIFVQILLAVEYLHNNNILHRDIKTENILLNCNPETGPIEHVLLADFGISKAVDPAVSGQARTALATTCLGTPLYMAPEQHAGKPYSSKADMWALGCVLCEMMTNRYAWQARDADELMRKYAAGTYTQPPTQYSRFLRATVKALLNPDPSHRPRASDILVHPEMQLYTAAALLRLERQRGMNSAAGATILEQAARLTTADRALHLRMDSGTVRVENSGGIAIGGITPGVAPKSTWLSSSKGGAAKDRCSIM